MTREEAQELLPVIQAFAEGKAIQSRAFKDGYWYDVDSTNDIDWDAHEYRVKPEPEYRPFGNADECWQEMQKHQPLGWVVKKSHSTIVCHLTSLSDSTVYLSHLHGVWSYGEMFPAFSFADGTPFGIKMEE